MVLEKTPEHPLDSKEINRSILREINPEFSLEGLMLKLKLQYFGHLMRTDDSLEKSLMLRKIEGRRRGLDAGWHHRCSARELGKTPGDGEGREAWRAAVHGDAKSWTWLSNLTELKFPHFTHISEGYQVNLLWSIQFAVKA